MINKRNKRHCARRTKCKIVVYRRATQKEREQGK
jgi:hypothetical protein